jgi:hypothetical protein
MARKWSPQGQYDLFQGLENNKFNNCIIDLSGWNINCEMLSELLGILRKKDKEEISGLDLSLIKIDDGDSLESIIELLAENFTLNTLILSRNGLRGKEAVILAGNPYIRDLDLSFNMIDDLKGLIQSKNLVSLNLCNNYIEDDHLRVLELNNNEEGTLVYLDFSANRRITHDGLQHILANDNLSRLDLSYIELSHRSIALLANSKIDFLTLRECAIRDYQVKDLVQYDCFIGLDLGNNSRMACEKTANVITFEGMLEVVEKSKKLEELRLDNLNLFDLNPKGIFEVFLKNRKNKKCRRLFMDALAKSNLSELHVRNNGLNDEYILAIAQQIKDSCHSNLRILSISDDNITDKGIRALVDVLSGGVSQLRSLSLEVSKYRISPHDVDARLKDLLEMEALSPLNDWGVEFKAVLKSLKPSLDSLRALLDPLASESQRWVDNDSAVMALCYHFKHYLEAEDIKKSAEVQVLTKILEMSGAKEVRRMHV